MRPSSAQSSARQPNACISGARKSAGSATRPVSTTSAPLSSAGSSASAPRYALAEIRRSPRSDARRPPSSSSSGSCAHPVEHVVAADDGDAQPRQAEFARDGDRRGAGGARVGCAHVGDHRHALARRPAARRAGVPRAAVVAVAGVAQAAHLGERDRALGQAL